MSVLVPTHLAGRTIPQTTDEGRSFRLRSAQGGTQFNIYYSGQLLPEHDLIVDDEAPALVVARALDTAEEIVVFDGGRHGYNAMFVDEHDPQTLNNRVPSQQLVRDGHTDFVVEVHLFDNIDWDDEEDDFRDDSGALRLITGQQITPEQLRADGFDAFTMTVIAPDGSRADIVNEELA
jgi:hypothetical protein